MEQTKKAIALVLCVSFLSLGVPPISNPPAARADDSDIFILNNRPNVLIMLDNSESMAWGIQSSEYVHNTHYPQKHMCSDLKADCITETVYKGMGIHPSGGYPRYSVYSNAIDDVASTEAQDALATVGYWVGKIKGSQVHLYSGNYLNYLYCTDATYCAGSEARIDIAKRVLTNLVNSVDGVRFGLMDFNQSPPGAHMVFEIGSSKTAMVNGIAGITTGGGTPLGGQMRDAAAYYKGIYQGYASPIQNACQANYVILITDGLQTDTQSSNAVQVQAGIAFRQDHSTSIPGLQNLITHTIGFAMEGGEDELNQAKAALQEAATNGGGSFYDAANEAALQEALLKAVYQIMEGVFAFATPVVPTTSATGISRAYMAAFQTSSNPTQPFWRGYLKAFNRDEQGQLRTNADGTPDEACTLTFADGTTKPCLAWEAGDVLSRKDPGSRAIKILSGTNLVDFSSGNVTPSDLGVSTAAERDHIVNFVRGVDVNDEDLDTDTTEVRPWKLGDIYHSTPVLVTQPFLPSSDPTYRAFRAGYASRPPILFAGANDGMLHAFRESDGEEVWAFLPPNLLPALKRVAARSGLHQFYVDSSPIAADVKIQRGAPYNDSVPGWRTIAVFGERRGGNAYYALDITEPGLPGYLWSFTDNKVSESWSEPVIGKVKMSSVTGSTERYVAFFGGGYDTQSNNSHGKAVFAVDVATGQKLWEYYNDGATDDRQYMNYSIPASPLALDLNGDGYIDRLYIGDIGGQLWKFDLSAAATLSGGNSGTVNNWTGKRFFVASADANPPAEGEYYPSQPIYGTPNAAIGSDGKLWLYFGTGDRNHPNNTSANRFYGIRDDQAGASAMNQATAWTNSNLSDATSAAPNLTTTKGWYVQLASTEKVVAPPDIFNQVVYFTSFTPSTAAAAACGTGGTAKLYAVQMLNGFAALNWATGDVLGASATAASTRGTSIGEGMPTGSSVSLTDTSTEVFAVSIAGKSDGTISILPAPAPANMRRILYWREVF
jgi:type IV pilus assembly protein PilY1